MKFKTFVNSTNIYRRYVEAIDVFTKLSEREKDVFAILLRVQHKWNDDRINVTDTRSRKEIMRNTYVSKSNLSKYIKSLREKNVLRKGEYGDVINPLLFPNFDEHLIVATDFIKEDEGE